VDIKPKFIEPITIKIEQKFIGRGIVLSAIQTARILKKE